MKRFELWQMEYRANRYMQYLSRCDLEQRARDIFTNLTMLSQDGKLGVVSHRDQPDWVVMWSDVLEEFGLRDESPSISIQNGFLQSADYPDPRNPLAKKAAEAVKRYTLKPGSYLVKYGRSGHLQTMLEGRVRIAPASYYRDSSLNAAIRDDELRVSCQTRPHPLKLIDPVSREQKGWIKPTSEIVFTLECSSDYFVFCLSAVLAPRLFIDFEADACLLIRTPELTVPRLIKSVAPLLPGWSVIVLPTKYIDPLHLRPEHLRLFEQKHFRYAYQRELRVAWLPPSPIEKLEPLYCTAGDLKASCELILL